MASSAPISVRSGSRDGSHCVWRHWLGSRSNEEQEGPLTAAEILQTRFAGRRSLLVLDNLETQAEPEAGTSAERYRDLLLPSSRCRMLITSGDREVLSALGVPAAAQLEVGVLEPPEARSLCEAEVGPAEVEAEPDAVDRLISLTGRLALALRLAARAVALDRGPAPFARAVTELEAAKTRIDRLSLDGPVAEALRPVFELGLARAGSEERQLFARLSVCTPAGFRRGAALAAGGLEPLAGRRRLARLVHLGLLEHSQETDRFRWHSLLHLRAREEAEALGGTVEAQARYEAFYTEFVRARSETTQRNVSELLDDEEAILDVARGLADSGRLELSFLTGLNVLLDQTGGWATGAELMQSALDALGPGDLRWNAILHLQVGKNLLRRGDLKAAIDCFNNSLRINRDLGDRRGEAMAVNSLGGARRDAGDLNAAIELFEQSLEIERELGNRRGEAMALNSLGGARRDAGDLKAASELFEQSLDIERELGDRRGEAMALNSLGGARRDAGDLTAAIGCFSNSLQIRREMGDRRGEAMVLNSLGGALRDAGKVAAAVEAYEACLALQVDAGFDVALGTVRSNLKELRRWARDLSACQSDAEREALLARYHFGCGQARYSNHDYYGALLQYTRALELSEDEELRLQCHARLGLAASRARDHERAREHFALVLAAGGGDSVLHASYGRTLQELGAPFEEVAAQYQAALEHDPQNVWALSWYALALSQRGDHAPAEKLARRAVALQSEYSALLTNLARVLVAAGSPPQREEAERVLEQAVAKAPIGFHGPRLLLEELRHPPTRSANSDHTTS